MGLDAGGTAVIGENGSEHILRALYGSITQPESSLELIQELCRATHSNVGADLCHDYAKSRSSIRAYYGMPGEAQKLYETQYAGIGENPWLPIYAEFAQRPGEVWISDALLPFAQLRQSSYWKAFLRPLNIDHGTAFVGVDNHRHRLSLTLMRSHRAGPYGNTERNLLQQIAPHWINVQALKQDFGVMQGSMTTLEDALNGAALAIFLIDNNGRVCRLNAAAERLLSKAHVLRLHDERLYARNSVDSHHLGRAIELASAQKIRIENKPHSTPRIALRDPAGSVAAFARIRPLVRGSAEDLVPKSPAAAVFVNCLNPTDHVALQATLREIFELTHSEATLAFALYAEGDLAAAAKQVGISAGSARTRLKTIFQKTGSTGQLGLIKLISELKLVSK